MYVHGMVGHLIRRLSQISTHVFSTRMQEEGIALTPVQFAALDAILGNPGVDQASVAQMIAYDRATIGGVIDRLVAKNLVRRTVNTKDRRARSLHLTEEGEALFNRALPVVSALQPGILAGLSDQERRQFEELAAKAVNHNPS